MASKSNTEEISWNTKLSISVSNVLLKHSKKHYLTSCLSGARISRNYPQKTSGRITREHKMRAADSRAVLPVLMARLMRLLVSDQPANDDDEHNLIPPAWHEYYLSFSLNSLHLKKPHFMKKCSKRTQKPYIHDICLYRYFKFVNRIHHFSENRRDD